MADERKFPVMTGRTGSGRFSIPWSLAEEAYAGYSGEQGTGQSLERLAERGGFHEGEMDKYVPDWRERTSEIARLRAEVERLTRERDEVRKQLDKLEVYDREQHDALRAELDDLERVRLHEVATRESQVAALRALLGQLVGALRKYARGSFWPTKALHVEGCPCVNCDAGETARDTLAAAAPYLPHAE